MKRDAKRHFNFRIASREQEEKPAAMKYLRLAVLFCFVAGIIGANIIGRDQLNGFGIWNTYFIEKFKYARIQPAELFYYVLGERLPIMLLLLLLTVTNWGIAAGGAFLSWQSFAAGFLMAAAVIAYGVKGILLMGAAFFPQYLLYVPLYMVYIYLAVFFRGKSRIGGGTVNAGKLRDYAIFFSICLLLLSVYVTGIFLESYVNPYLLKKILKIF